MASQPTDSVEATIGDVQRQLVSTVWEKALVDILYFVEHYVPKDLFDLKRAAPQQLALLRAVQDGKRNIAIRAPRKGGKTICVAIIAVWLTLRDQTYRVFILSGSEYQAKWLYDYCKKILAPIGPENRERRKFFIEFLKREPMLGQTEYRKGGWIMYAAASSKQVNAPTADCEIMDEYVLIPSNIVQEAWPMIRESEDPRRFILSTATPDKENTESFLSILEDSEDLGFIKFEWEDKDCPFLQTKIALEDARIAEKFLSPDMYITQYKGGIPKKAGPIFPRTFIRETFIASDPANPGFLLDGTPYDPENLKFLGDSKGGVDWGFDHQTVMLEGYRDLRKKIVLAKCIHNDGTSASDWGQQAYDDSTKFGITEWYADASGAFQNQEIRDKGLKITSRAFQHQSQGKEWMIGIAYYWLQKNIVVIPDTEEFKPLKDQMMKYRRGQDGKPVKGFDDFVDSFLCLISGWDPRYYEETENYKQPEAKPIASSSNNWDSFQSKAQGWMPDHWQERKRELIKNPWEKT